MSAARLLPRALGASAALVLLLGLPGVAHTQVAPRADSALHARLAAIRPGALVRVDLAPGGRVAGPLVAVSADTLRLDGSAPVPLGAVRTVWVRGRRTRQGATIGAIGGGAGGVAVGTLFGAVVAALCEYDCPSSGHAMAVGGLLGGVAGGVGGGVLGGIIGAVIPRWERRWP